MLSSENQLSVMLQRASVRPGATASCLVIYSNIYNNNIMTKNSVLVMSFLYSFWIFKLSIETKESDAALPNDMTLKVPLWTKYT